MKVRDDREETGQDWFGTVRKKETWVDQNDHEKSYLKSDISMRMEHIFQFKACLKLLKTFRPSLIWKKGIHVSKIWESNSTSTRTVSKYVLT